jgi:hypothetical protein
MMNSIPIDACDICCGDGPFEVHHVATRRQYNHLTLRVCRVCHVDLTQRQYRWRINWRTEYRPIACVVQGVADCLAVWYDRSPFVEPLRALFTMLTSAAVALLACFRLDALACLAFITDTAEE